MSLLSKQRLAERKSAHEMTRNALRSKTYLRFLFSFCSVLLLLFLAFSLLFRIGTTKSEEKKIELRGQSSTELSALYADHLLSTMNSIVSSISSNRSIAEYRARDDSVTRSQVIAALLQQQAFSELISNIFYLPAQNDFLFSSSSTFTSETFFRLFKREALTADDVSALFARSAMPVIAFPDTITDQVQKAGISQKVLSVLYPLPSGGVGKYAILLFDIDLNKVQKTLYAGMEYGHVLIIDAQGNILIDSSDSTFHASSLFDLSALSGIADGTFSQLGGADGKNYYLFSQSLLQGWKLLYFVPRVILTDAVNAQWMQYSLFMVVILLLGVAISFALSIINYHPIGALHQKLQAIETGQHPRFSDDIKDIAERATSIAQQNNSLTTRLEDHHEAIIGQHLFNIVNNRASSEELRSLPEDGMLLRYDNYVVALFAPRLNTMIHREGGWIAELQAVVPASWDAYFWEYQASRLYVGLFSLPVMALDMLFDKLNEIRQMLPAPVTVGVSAPNPDLSNLAPSFIQAQLALQQRFFQGDSRVYMEQNASAARDHLHYPHAQLHKLDIGLANKDKAACQQALDEMFSVIRCDSMSMETLYCVCFEVVNQIIRRLVAANIPLTQIETLLPDILQVTRNETLDDMQDLLNDAMESALYALSTPQEGAAECFPAFQEIFDYVENVCYRSDFSVQMLSERFGVSYPYLGKQFKAFTGVTINKYVQRQRITQARKLLVETDYTLSQIVEDVGYIDLSSFIKLFKQETGMTPIAYRKLYQ